MKECFIIIFTFKIYTPTWFFWFAKLDLLFPILTCNYLRQGLILQISRFKCPFYLSIKWNFSGLVYSPLHTHTPPGKIFQGSPITYKRSRFGMCMKSTQFKTCEEPNSQCPDPRHYFYSQVIPPVVSVCFIRSVNNTRCSVFSSESACHWIFS